MLTHPTLDQLRALKLDGMGVIQADKPHSSQALAIDVFGTIKVCEDRNRVLGALAERCGLPGDGPWQIELEWSPRKTLLGERTVTQVDAMAVGRRSVILFEGKFTERGGPCSQTRRITDGAYKDRRQCDGHYTPQTNPVNGKTAACALSGKGVRYWDLIPGIFGLDVDREYRPCPFAGETYQWMRNTVLAAALAKDLDRSSAVVAAYADAPNLPTAHEARSGLLGYPSASGKSLIIPLSWARSVAERPEMWDDLATWINRKIASVVTIP